jgi:alpha-tubulin suppressor-like RCC1 family protein
VQQVKEPTKVLTNAKQVTAGAFNSFVLKNDGTLWGWGFDLQGGSANLTSPQQLDPGTNWVNISAGDFHLLGLKLDGTLWIAGANAHITAESYITNRTTAGRAIGFAQVGPETNWVDIVSGQNGFMARKSDGSWWMCGRGEPGLLHGSGRIRTLTRVSIDLKPLAIATGGETTQVLMPDGKLWSFGERIGSPPQTVGFRKGKEIANGILYPIAQRPVFNTRPIPFDIPPRLLWDANEQ